MGQPKQLELTMDEVLYLEELLRMVIGMGLPTGLSEMPHINIADILLAKLEKL